MVPLLVSSIVKSPILRVEESIMHDLNFLLRVQFDLHDECIPKISNFHEFMISVKLEKYNLIESFNTLGSSGGSNWTIQSTAGISNPRAATSVHSRVPDSALQN